MNLYVEIILRTAIALLILSVMTFLLGVKHISQMTSFDYIVSITIGSVAGALCVDDDISIWGAIISMVILIGFAFLLTLLNRKTIFFRRTLTGTPTLLIDQGEIMYEGLKHVRLSVNDLLRELRYQGYFNISDIEHAIMENNGTISILPKAEKRPLTPEDMQIVVPKPQIMANVVIDGKIMHGNLSAMNRTTKWLFTEIENQGQQLADIMLATLDSEGNLSIYDKNNNSQRRTVLE